MKKLLAGIQRFTLRQKIAVGIMVVLILMTWLAVCLILTGFWGP